ncbi:uncharacterized protein LOC125077613 [Vanessa atalanta]|uniref:uncharacterized protein LOC125077613 n=1 Tax=Vanessa atalanta TaxID=42275 RepID=UPI001FCDD358|nr:uncharacterized protein LOC125077613 [Vanessa atalanta]
MMGLISKPYRYLLFSKCYKCFLQSSISIQKVTINKFHSTTNVYAKMFIEHENKYACNVMENNGYPVVLTNIDIRKPQTLSGEHYKNILENNWLKETPQTIFQLFSSLGEYCSQHNICISSKQFDNYIDALTDRIQVATDEELKSIFYALKKWPETESIRTRNYIEVWAALDDECFNRLKNWSFDEMLSFMSLFYMLNVTKLSSFASRCLLKFTSKAKQLTKTQLVQTLFFIGIMRKSPPEIHNLEIKVEERFTEFTVDELAIIAMGLFKSKTPIRSITLISKFMDKIIENSSQIHEVSLASLLKIIRYSIKKTENNKMYDMLETLQHETPRLSIMCNVQMALVGSSTLTLHENCLKKIAEAAIVSIPTARLKDLERLVLTYGIFNFKPKTKFCLFSKVLDELRNPERAEEINQHGRSFSCCVAYLCLLNIHAFDLMNKILSSDFLQNAYGKHCYQYGREILTIHNTVKIFGKNKVVNLLKDNQVVLLSKKYTDYIPNEDYEKQYNISEKMFIDVVNILRDMRGGKNFVTSYHILTHHQRGDIIICDSNEGFPLQVDKAFSEKKFGFIMEPPNNNKWVCLIIAGKNTIIHNTNSPTGHFYTKMKELNALGYCAAIVSWDIYSKLEKKDDKIEYLNTVIKEAVNSKL